MHREKKKFDVFGWGNTLRQVAESGMFNKNGYTPLESAKMANFHEAISYLANVAQINS
jgi:hypothetical protein